ncbi:DM13 domain-containing protein [Methylophaga sulfidovorans]|uniref:Electron transfer DM13 n=1 Tax=Methylophaga sulfidovorans TaxID=45496 RepID=A0A1I3WD20_9GAMM|nr:DM13 domain-containing protein [Methylophaga sulfidovorans]SFK04316.1 Electron transfer DM13 [Methylophaga sulfidovorans]
MKKVLLLITHGLMLVVGFALGIYALPILTQPDKPSMTDIGKVATSALFTGQFERDLEGSDALHYGNGTIYINAQKIAFDGQISPGPDYKLYLSPVFVENKTDFLKNKDKMLKVGDVRTFNSFLLDMPDGVNPADYQAVVIWCESFNIFITAAKYH